MRTRCRGTGRRLPPRGCRGRHRRWQGRVPSGARNRSVSTPGRAGRPDHQIVDPAVGITGFRQGCGEAFAECGTEPFEPFFGGAVEPDGPGAAAFQFGGTRRSGRRVPLWKRLGEGGPQTGSCPAEGFGNVPPPRYSATPAVTAKRIAAVQQTARCRARRPGGWKGRGWQCFEEELPYEQGMCRNPG